MAYPQDGATYKHTPKWLDEAKKEESKSITPYKQSDFKPPETFESKTQRDHAHVVAREEGGTVVRGPQGFREKLGDALNSVGLPGSTDFSELEAYPTGVAAIGRAAFGSTPNDRVRRGFDMINRRTVK